MDFVFFFTCSPPGGGFNQPGSPWGWGRRPECMAELESSTTHAHHASPCSASLLELAVFLAFTLHLGPVGLTPPLLPEKKATD